ncbi:ABC transporter substrate-binding protein [Streptomyces zaomyceticus]|uniref:ABC transporter substrate-binding protein n=1 Tax=Streptomyces zaomyceticus TaxID=68286 RepID=UPI0036B13C5C
MARPPVRISAHAHTRTIAFVTTAIAAAALLTGCSSSTGSRVPAPSGEKISLTIGTFGTFGYKEAGLFDEYMRLHPEITIEEHSTTQEPDYWKALEARLSDGGLYDVQALEVGRISLATSHEHSGAFEDLSQAPGVKQRDHLPWKWDQATTAGGRTIGLGTDVGPMAVCYRQDLFKAAGLPSDPDAVAELWRGDWAKFVEVGKTYQSEAPKGTYFMDTAAGLYNAVVSSSPQQYYANGTLVYGESPSVKKGWDLAVRAIRAGTSQGLKEFDPPWQKAFSRGTFATTICPSWQQSNIEKFSGAANTGKWNIAQPPAAGNWGGSFLTVPSSGKHVEQAKELVAWLTSPEQQAKVFQKVGNFPANRAAYSLPGVVAYSNPYIGPEARTGMIFAMAAVAIQPAEIGPRAGELNNTIGDGILLMERDGKAPAEAWKTTLRRIDGSTQ